MRIIKKGAVDQTIYFDILDSASTTGGRKTGIAYNAASLIAYYTRAGAAAVQITLATQTAAGAHSDGGWVEVSATNAPGLYRLDLPDAVCTTGVDAVIVTVSGASGMVEASVEIQLSAVDVQTSTNMGLSALPTASPAASNGLPTVGTGSGQLNPTSGSSQFISNTGTAAGGAVNSIALANGASSVNSFYTRMIVLILSGTGAGQARMISTYAGNTRNATVFTPFATAPDATSVYVVLPLGTDEAAYNAWEEGVNAHTSGYTMGDTVRQLNTGTLIGDKVWGATTRTLSAGAITAATFAANALDAVWSVAARTLTAFGFTVATNSDSNVTAIKAKTDNLPASPAAVGSAMALTSGERATLTASIWDEVLGTHATGTARKDLADAAAISPPSAATIATEVWSKDLTGYSSSGQAIAAKSLLDVFVSGTSLDAIADHVWDEPIAGRTSTSAPTSYGAYLASMFSSSGARIKMFLKQLNIIAASGSGDSAIDATGDGQGHGISATGGTDATIGGDGIHGKGGDSATQGGSGVAGVAGAGNGTGIYGRATGNGSGIFGYGGAGAGADGIRGRGGVTSGDGMRLYPGGGNSNGFKAEHAGSGLDISAPVNDLGDSVADDVWDETIASHTTAGTTGATLVSAGAGGDPSAIADAVWAEDVTGSTTPGLAATQLNAAAVAGPDAATIADAVWDEVLPGAYFSTQAGGILAKTFRMDSSEYNSIVDQVVNEVWDELSSSHISSTTMGGKLNAAAAISPPTTSSIAAAVWDEAISGHLTTSAPTKFGQFFASMFDSAGARIKMYLKQLNIVAATGTNDAAITATGDGSGSGLYAAGSNGIHGITTGFGGAGVRMEGVGNPSVGLEISSVSDRGMKVTGSPAYPAIEASGKWGIAAFGTTTGLYANSNNIAPAADAVADAVWDETISGSTNTSKAAGQLNAAGAGGDPSAIAAAVWDEEISGHLTTSAPTKFGGFFASMFDSAGARIKMYLRQLNIRGGSEEHGVDIIGGTAAAGAAGSGIKAQGGDKGGGSIGGDGMTLLASGNASGLSANGGSVTTGAGGGGVGIKAIGSVFGGSGALILGNYPGADGITAAGNGAGLDIHALNHNLLDASVAELSATPASTASVKTMLKFLFMKFKNKNNLTKTGVASGTENVCKDDGTPISKRLFADNGSVSEWSKMENP